MIKNREEITGIRNSCNILTRAFNALRITEGMTTLQISDMIGNHIINFGGRPAFFGYDSFPAYACISVNDEIIHGVPNNRVVLKNGDIVSVDAGALVNGFYSDAAYTFTIGEVSPHISRMVNVTKESLYLGIAHAKAGNSVDDISNAIYDYVIGNHFDVVREFSGHGVGRDLHELPHVFNYPNSGFGDLTLEPGMVLAIEPMVVFGSPAIRRLNNGTIVTKSGRPAAHFEHTILITRNEPEILTPFYDTDECIVSL